MSDTNEKAPGGNPGKTKPAAEDWPNTIRSREELDSALEAGLKSGVSSRRIDEVVEDELSKLKDG